jgi:hypothetical protein
MKIGKVLLCLAVPLVGASDEGWLMSGSGSLSGGIGVRFMTRAEPALPAARAVFGGGGFSCRGDRVHRVVVDNARSSFFGYDLSVSSAGQGLFRIQFEPLSLTPEQMGMQHKGTPLKPETSPKYPEPDVVRLGDTIALDVLVSADGRSRIVDYIRLVAREEPSAADTRGVLNDYSVDDGPLVFSMEGESRAFRNGQEIPRVALTRKSGATIWFHFPGDGRLIISLVPREGYAFERTGEIRGNVIAFGSAAGQYEIRLPGPVVAGGGSYRVWVLHDPGFRPEVENEFASGGVDRLENLVKK